MHFDRGSLVVGRIRGIPVRLHWSIPVMMIFFSRFRFEPVFWATMMFVILVHELGHAWQVRRFGLRVTEVQLDGMGGHCAWSGTATPLQRAWIASGGVIAQLLLLPIAIVIFGFETHYGTWGQVQDGLIWTNLYMAAFNLIPYPPLDGAEAWKLPRLLQQQQRAKAEKQQRQQRKSANARQQAEKELAERDARVEDGISEDLIAQTDALLKDAFSEPSQNKDEN